MTRREQLREDRSHKNAGRKRRRFCSKLGHLWHTYTFFDWIFIDGQCVESKTGEDRYCLRCYVHPKIELVKDP